MALVKLGKTKEILKLNMTAMVYDMCILWNSVSSHFLISKEATVSETLPLFFKPIDLGKFKTKHMYSSPHFRPLNFPSSEVAE